MIYRTKVRVRSLGLALALLLVVSMSWAADPYPTRPIRWVVPWPAGGVADTQARIIADQLGKALGQQIMIDNRAGASGVIGADAVARSKPDGYTLLYVSPNEQAIAQAIGLEVRYDAAKDFTPITQFLRRPAVLVVKASLNVRTVAELVALVKAKGDSMSCGTPGVAHFNHFVTEVFHRRVGIKVPVVPYKGEAPMVNDLIGGQVDYGFGFATTVDPFVKAGRLHALATTGVSRSPHRPTCLLHRTGHARSGNDDLDRDGGPRRFAARDRRATASRAEQDIARPGHQYAPRIRRFRNHRQQAEEFRAFLAAEVALAEAGQGDGY
jgi:tripartite-type tricarboxylate transporter receptor subunit TctC